MGTDIEDIIIAKLSGQPLSKEEEVLFGQWYEQAGNSKRYYEWEKMGSAVYANAKASEISSDKAWQKISHQRQIHLFRRRFLQYAAIMVLFFSAGITFYWLRTPQSTTTITQNTLVSPGTEKAILTLSTGEKIALTNDRQTVTKDKGTVIRNNEPNALEYNKAEEFQEIAYNTLTIPRGGEYKLVLSDGTIVWLNSDSRLIFPVAFNGNTRELKLEGEAFFEVAGDQEKPFIVHTHQFDIRVTGTRFNVRTYPDEPESATLTEGGIQLEKNNRIHQLKPGQQAIIGQEVVIREVNIEEAIAWRNGVFCFKQSRLENIMNELSRWYDIEIFYLNPQLKDLHFTAWFQRSSSITEVIHILEKTKKIKLELKGKTLTVIAR